MAALLGRCCELGGGASCCPFDIAWDGCRCLCFARKRVGDASSEDGSAPCHSAGMRREGHCGLAFGGAPVAAGAPRVRVGAGLGSAFRGTDSAGEVSTHSVDESVYRCYVWRMSTTTIRVSISTRDALNELADRFGQTVAATVDRAVRLLEQEAIGNDLAAPLTDDELEWLDADAG